MFSKQVSQFGFSMALGFSVFALSGCGVSISKNIDDSDLQDASVISLSRTYQRVVRLDCANRVVSDQIETIASPTEQVRIDPRDSSHVISSSFENQTVGSRASCIVANSIFNVDYSDGWCNMRVTAGTNHIHYKFYYCETEDRYGNCVSGSDSYVGEEGDTIISVNYDETVEPGTAYLHATSCVP